MQKFRVVGRLLLLSLTGLLVAGICAGAERPKLSGHLAHHLQTLKPHDRVRVIVQTYGEVNGADLSDVYNHDGDVRDVYRYALNGYAAEVPAGQLEPLSRSRKVKHVSKDETVLMSTAWTMPTIKADVARTNYGVQGNGIGIAVVDSGVSSHDDLGGRLVAWKDTAENTSSYVDSNGHGTHVAGAAAGDGIASVSYSKNFGGVAPGANIIGVRVLGSNGSGSVSNVIAGLDWCIANKATYNIRVINLSLGHRVRESFTTDPLCQACERAWKAGIVVVVAAGNNGRKDPGNQYSGPAYGSIDSPGNDPYVITVGATNTKRTSSITDDLMASYSAVGPSAIDHILKPDLVAPGNRSISLRNLSGFLDSNYTFNRVDPASFSGGGTSKYFVLSGTSMAAPIVAGAVALMLQQDPTLTPDTVKARLMVSANSLVYLKNNVRASVFFRGAGLLDVNAAMSFSPGQVIPSGYAWSPKCVRGQTANLFFLSTGIFGGPSTLWTTLSGSNALWADTTASDEGIFGNNALWADVNDPVNGSNALWADNTGDESMFANNTLWGSNALWADDAAMADSLNILAVGDEGDL